MKVAVSTTVAGGQPTGEHIFLKIWCKHYRQQFPQANISVHSRWAFSTDELKIFDEYNVFPIVSELIPNRLGTCETEVQQVSYVMKWCKEKLDAGADVVVRTDCDEYLMSTSPSTILGEIIGELIIDTPYVRAVGWNVVDDDQNGYVVRYNEMYSKVCITKKHILWGRGFHMPYNDMGNAYVDMPLDNRLDLVHMAWWSRQAFYKKYELRKTAWGLDTSWVKEQFDEMQNGTRSPKWKHVPTTSYVTVPQHWQHLIP